MEKPKGILNFFKAKVKGVVESSSSALKEVKDKLLPTSASKRDIIRISSAELFSPETIALYNSNEKKVKR